MAIFLPIIKHFWNNWNACAANVFISRKIATYWSQWFARCFKFVEHEKCTQQKRSYTHTMNKKNGYKFQFKMKPKQRAAAVMFSYRCAAVPTCWKWIQKHACCGCHESPHRRTFETSLDWAMHSSLTFDGCGELDRVASTLLHFNLLSFERRSVWITHCSRIIHSKSV